jgi:hypothetical protein
VYGSNARNLSVKLSLSQIEKRFVFLITAYVFSSTKWSKGQNRFCLEARDVGEEREWVGGKGKK